MKRILSYILVFTVVFLTSCNDDLLEENPTSFASPVNFYRNADDAFAALNGVYNRLLGLYQSTGFQIMYCEHGTDLLTHRPGHPLLMGVASYTLTSQEPRCEDHWRAHYDMVNRANSVLDRIPEIDMGEEEKKQILGEAHFLRAFAYFNLVRAWGDVPLLIHETTSLDNLDVSRNTSVEVYNQIIEDLQQAENLLELYANNQRVTAGAAKTLLGKVYLQMAGYPIKDASKYPLAAQKLKEVIDSDIYTLLSNYSDVFDPNNEDNNEIIFAVQFLDGGLGQGAGNGRIYGPAGNFPDGGAIAFHAINTEFALSFDSLDDRLYQNVANFNISNGAVFPTPKSGAGWRPWKWHKPVPVPYGQADDPIDFPLLRYADVLLMYAEALNAINNGPDTEAYNMINQVRNRAGLGDLSTGMTQEEFLDALIDERAWELCFEGHRRPDLIRTEKLIEKVRAIPRETQYYDYVSGLNIQDFHRLWPIPQREIDLNPNLTQNPNY